jgi:hypothetical protein
MATPVRTMLWQQDAPKRTAGSRIGLGALALGLALAILTAAWMSPWFRTSEGDLSGRFAAAIAAAAASAILCLTARSAWACFGRWMALALAGQAAALQLIDAGILIHYQHYRLPSQALADPVFRWALVVVSVQTAFVVRALTVRRRAIHNWLQKPRRLTCLAAGILICGCVAAAVSRDQRFFLQEVSLAAFIQFMNAGNILLAAWSLPQTGLVTLGEKFDSWLGMRTEAEPVAIDRFVTIAACFVTIVSALLAWFVYERHPHVADEVVYLYNARYFAASMVAMPPPPLVPAFEVDLMEYQPHQWYGAVPLGWPAILALGAALGLPWLVNPLLAGINILLAYLFLGELYSRRTARIAVLLLCLSPWQIFLAMSFMTHTVTMTCALLAFLGVAKARRTGLARWAWLAGTGCGVGSLIRPLDGLIIGALAGAWAIGMGGKRLKLPALAALATATLITAAAALPYNKALTGDPTASPLMRYTDEHYAPKANAYGFGPERGLGWPTDAYPGHTPFEALINAELNGACLNTDLFGWSSGSLLLVVIMLLSGALRRADYLMLVAIAAVIIAYAPYWGTGGPDFGARYWYLILVPAVALSVRGLEWLETQLGPSWRNDTRATAAVETLCCLAAINYFPWRSLDKYRHYLRMRPDAHALARTHHFGRSLVLVRGERFPDYASAAIYNPLDLTADAPVYAWDRSPAVREKILQIYADRPVWIMEGHSVTQAGFRVTAGPLKAAAANPRVSP